ncbi:TetR/AcrR family transcriptional regulator [Companilactobacillus farciminis]|nr:TetR/AcrR family transcriptional regulator [Companilactobacillus farciminis]
MTEDLRIIKTVRDIQIGFIELLQTKSFDKITVNDICRTSLVGRSTFYHHYTDKYDLLEQMIQEQASTFDQLLFNRMQEIDQDRLLIELYDGLNKDTRVIITLLKIPLEKGSLKSFYLKSLKKYFSKIAPQLNLKVPDDFLGDFYASSALTSIIWSLKNDHQDEIAEFMNDLVRKLIR